VALRHIRWVVLGSFAVYAVSTLLARGSAGEPFISFDDLTMVIGVFIILVLPYIPRILARRQFRSAEFAKIREPRRVEISAAGLRYTGGTGESLTLWPSILDIAVTPEAAYLFVLKNSAHIVPRHAFTDEASFDRFVDVARAYWRPAAPAVAT
jgi:hypothetical protein